MSAIVVGDISINTAGDIRWTGSATTPRHTILEFIEFLMDKQDDGQAAGDDLLDITVDTPFDRSTDQIVTLNKPFNVDDTFMKHLYDGSVSQQDPFVGGETIYSGLNLIGPVQSGTEYMILQDGKVIASFWGTGINPEVAPSLVFSRHLVKSKHGGAKIDGQRITVLARELGDQYRRFPVTLGTGNSVAAIGNGADIFNTTNDATLAGFTTIINTEGFQELDIDATGAAGQEFYSQWDTGSQSVNETYERTKWISQRSHVADLTGGTPTGADFVIENATIIGQAQSFIPLSGTEKLTYAIAKVKILAGTPTGNVYAELWDSDDVGSQLAEPTGGALARSENILASAITSAYEDVIFRFNRTNPATGVDQVAGLDLGNAEYFIVFRHDEGDAGNNFSLEGASTDVDSTMNQADDTAAVWTASATDDINIIVKSSPVIHNVPGEIFQGINIEVGYDGEIGTGVAEDNIVLWGTKVTYDVLDAGAFRPGEYVTFNTPADIVSGIDIGFAATTNIIDRASGSWITDNYAVDDYVHVSGSTSNDGRVGKVLAVTALNLTVDGILVTEAAAAGRIVTRLTAVVAGGRILYDDGVDEIVVSMDAQSTLLDNQIISTVRGGSLAIGTEATALINVTLVDDDKSGGTGILLAKDDNGVDGELYLQVLSGSNPVDNNIIRRDDTSGDPLADSAVATAVLNTKTVSPEYLGTSTGSNIIGAYGIGFVPGDVGSSDRFTDLADGSRIPPNNQTFTVTGLVSGEDRVLVGPRTGVLLERGQFVLNGALTGGAVVSIVVGDGAEDGTPLAGDIPQDGSTLNTRLRVQLDTGVYRRQAYTSHSVSTFTIPSTDYSGANQAANGNDVFVAFIDVLADAISEAYTATFVATRNLFVRVRDGGGTPIKTFESTSAQFLGTPQTVAAVRTPDA